MYFRANVTVINFLDNLNQDEERIRFQITLIFCFFFFASVNSSQVKFFMTIRKCLLWSFQMFFPISVRIRTCQFQCLSCFQLNSSMVLLCTVSCGRLFQSRDALIVKKFFRTTIFALRTTTLHVLPLEPLSFRSNSRAVAFLS